MVAACSYDSPCRILRSWISDGKQLCCISLIILSCASFNSSTQRVPWHVLLVLNRRQWATVLMSLLKHEKRFQIWSSCDSAIRQKRVFSSSNCAVKLISHTGHCDSGWINQLGPVFHLSFRKNSLGNKPLDRKSAGFWLVGTCLQSYLFVSVVYLILCLRWRFLTSLVQCLSNEGLCSSQSRILFYLHAT